MWLDGFKDGQSREQKVTGRWREPPDRRRERGRQGDGARLLHRRRSAGHLLEFVEFAAVIERDRAAEDLAEDRVPLAALFVAGVMLGLTVPEHVELFLVPAAHDIEPGASATDV